MQGISDVRQSLQFINAFNAPLSWLRVLKYMEELSPKTRQASTMVDSYQLLIGCVPRAHTGTSCLLGVPNESYTH